MVKADAISMLEQDHKHIRELLHKLTSTTERGVKTRQHLLAEVEWLLKMHMRIEEDIFYPTFKNVATKKEDARLFFEAVEEHHAADKVLAELVKTDPASDEFGGKAKVLKELVLTHADDEEAELFPRVLQLLNKDQLTELAEAMQVRRQDLDEGRSRDRRHHAAE
jgi:hemerythrin superfamily protein